MSALVLVGLMAFGFAYGTGEIQPSTWQLRLARSLPVLLFFVWAPGGMFGALSAFLLSNGFYVLGKNFGTKTENPFIDREPIVGKWLFEKYGSKASLAWMAGCFILGALLYGIA